MRKAASWRGSANATPKDDFMHLLRVLKPSKEKDIFFDIGCGYGRLCIWIADRVKLAVGIENHYYRFLRARLNVKRSGLDNIVIKRADLELVSYKKSTIIYSMVDAGFNVWAKIDRQSRHGTIIVQYWRPPYPIKGKALFGDYFLVRTPLTRVKDENEYARIFFQRKSATIKELYEFLNREDRKLLKEEIRDSMSCWNRLTRQRMGGHLD